MFSGEISFESSSVLLMQTQINVFLHMLFLINAQVNAHGTGRQIRQMSVKKKAVKEQHFSFSIIFIDSTGVTK